jgi:NAD-dependent deacetylase
VIAAQKLQQAKLAVLTGAGISQPSGIPTFRDAAGLWKDFNIDEYATAEAYARNPTKVWEWYAWRYHNVQEANPNQAHVDLVRLEQVVDGFCLVTQNVDNLHTKAGSKRVIELHGNITQAQCEQCGKRFSLASTIPPYCPTCGARGRPGVVWFGEMLPQKAFEEAYQAFASCDVALVIGTSAEVEPAASLGRIAIFSGAYTIEINPSTTPLSGLVDLHLPMGAVEGMDFLMRLV